MILVDAAVLGKRTCTSQVHIQALVASLSIVRDEEVSSRTWCFVLKHSRLGHSTLCISFNRNALNRLVYRTACRSTTVSLSNLGV